MTRLEPGLEFVPGLTLVRRVGRGGMGDVWVARDASRDEEVVAKILPADAPAERVALLRREARLVRKVRHSGIVPVYGFEQGPHGSAVVLRFMPGGDAGQLRGATPLEVVRVARAVGEALAHLHRLGVVHRDVKPTNVLLDGTGRAHLADFGIAAVADPHDDEGLVLHGGGSRASMSPQQRTGEPARPADDVYALGALLQELLSGQSRFPAGATDEEMDAAAPPVLEVAVPERLRTLVESMLAPSPADRPPDMNAVVDALRAVEDELAPSAPAPGPPPAPAPPPVRLQPPPRVPEVGVVATAPVHAPPVPPSPASSPRPLPRASRRPRTSSSSRLVLFGALGLAVLFVVLVLPRWAQPPGSAAPSVSEPEVATPAPGPDPQLPAEATPTPVAPPVPAPPRSRPAAPAPGSPREPVAEAARPPSDAEFATAMSETQAALERKDWPAARAALTRASSLRPGSSSVADARRRVEDGERAAALGAQREVARSFEAKEDWARALAEYQAALKLDPAVAFALEGRVRTEARAALAERLAFHIAHPLRLATDAVAREAERLLQEAREVASPGPRHQRQVASLEKTLAEVRTPVAVVLESDGETEVVVHKIGRLGTFTQKRLELRPGTYTVVGTRPGYRDVRRQLVVDRAAAPPSLVVRCEEEI